MHIQNTDGNIAPALWVSFAAQNSRQPTVVVVVLVMQLSEIRKRVGGCMQVGVGSGVDGWYCGLLRSA